MQPIPANQLLAGLTLAEPIPIHAVVTDSRKVEPGCVFVCFPGERVDGHTFAAGAYRTVPPISLPTIRWRAFRQNAPWWYRTVPWPWCVWPPTTACCSPHGSSE